MVSNMVAARDRARRFVARTRIVRFGAARENRRAARIYSSPLNAAVYQRWYALATVLRRGMTFSLNRRCLLHHGGIRLWRRNRDGGALRGASGRA